MLTLKELKKIVKVADVEKRIPSVKSLKEHKVVVKEMINADTTISVYDHGYVLYTAGNQSTVFPLHSCDDYEYVSVTGDNKEFNKEFFDNENWYIRLLMEAEDRMAYSQSKISTNHGVFSNSDVTDDAEIMRGSSKDFVDDVIDREILNALIKELTERQKTVLNLVYFEEMRQQDVADYLGINVYMLSQIDENDLSEFLDKDSTATVVTPQPDKSKVVLDETNNEDVDKEATIDPEKTASAKTNMGAMATILILALGGVAAYYYFKIYKPKKEEDEDDQPEGLETGGLEEVPDEEESEDEDFEENEK